MASRTTYFCPACKRFWEDYGIVHVYVKVKEILIEEEDNFVCENGDTIHKVRCRPCFLSTLNQIRVEKMKNHMRISNIQRRNKEERLFELIESEEE